MVTKWLNRKNYRYSAFRKLVYKFLTISDQSGPNRAAVNYLTLKSNFRSADCT
jgi:hypothetical protein